MEIPENSEWTRLLDIQRSEPTFLGDSFLFCMFPNPDALKHASGPNQGHGYDPNILNSKLQMPHSLSPSIYSRISAWRHQLVAQPPQPVYGISQEVNSIEREKRAREESEKRSLTVFSILATLKVGLSVIVVFCVGMGNAVLAN
jgi:hypothetical protein